MKEIYDWYGALAIAESRASAFKQFKEEYGTWVYEEAPKLKEIKVFSRPYTLSFCGELMEYSKEDFIVLATTKDSGVILGSE